MAAAGADGWYRRSRLVESRSRRLLRSLPMRSGNTTDPSVDSRTEVVTVDVAGTIALSEPPPGTSALSVLVTRGHAAIGRLEVETGGRRPSDRLLRELLIDELGVRVLEESATRDARRRSPGGPRRPGGVVQTRRRGRSCEVRATECRSSSPAWIAPTRSASAWIPCAATAAGTRSRSWWSTTTRLPG